MNRNSKVQRKRNQEHNQLNNKNKLNPNLQGQNREMSMILQHKSKKYQKFREIPKMNLRS